MKSYLSNEHNTNKLFLLTKCVYMTLQGALSGLGQFLADGTCFLSHLKSSFRSQDI